MPTNSDIITAAGDLFATVPGVQTNRGVAMNPPPTAYFGDTVRMVREAMSVMPEDGRLQLVGVANKNPNTGKLDTNVALAMRVGSSVEVVGWLGKAWGEPVSAGVMGVYTLRKK